MSARTGARITRLAALAVAAGTLAATSAGAQAGITQDTRWRAWIGCWEPVGPDGGAGDAEGMRVCVVPAAGSSAVDIVNVTNGAVAERTHVEASGEKRTIGREGCTGVESAAWSPDNRRVYLTAEITCDGVRRTTNGLLAFSQVGEWLDVQGVMTGQTGTSGVHVTRYRPVADLSRIPADVREAIGNMGLAVSTARAVASAPLSTADVVDAVKHLDKPVIEAWLLERGQGFDLDAKQLVALADAGVPGAVTDLMVALSNPKVFAIDRAAREAEMLPRQRGQDANVVTGRTIPAYAYSPFGWGPYGSYYSWYGNRYGYGYGPYGGYGYGNGWYYGNRPIIIVNRGDGSSSGSIVTTRPRMVNGQGYTEGRRTTTSSPSSSSGSRSSGGSSSSGSSSGSSSSGSSSAGSSSSGDGGGRTAKPRP
jgi:hypothetical protein